jgi:hypothetical protein
MSSIWFLPLDPTTISFLLFPLMSSLVTMSVANILVPEIFIPF